MDGKAAASDQLKALLSDPQLMAALRDRAAERKALPEAEKTKDE
jgi:type VI secretion system protein ImpB